VKFFLYFLTIFLDKNEIEGKIFIVKKFPIIFGEVIMGNNNTANIYLGPKETEERCQA
jgi:hypothetical protein